MKSKHVLHLLRRKRGVSCLNRVRAFSWTQSHIPFQFHSSLIRFWRRTRFWRWQLTPNSSIFLLPPLGLVSFWPPPPPTTSTYMSLSFIWMQYQDHSFPPLPNNKRLKIFFLLILLSKNKIPRSWLVCLIIFCAFHLLPWGASLLLTHCPCWKR